MGTGMILTCPLRLPTLYANRVHVVEAAPSSGVGDHYGDHWPSTKRAALKC